MMPFIKHDLQHSRWREQLVRGVRFVLKSGTIYHIRHMTLNDIAQIIPLERQIFIDPWPVDFFRTELEHGDRCLALVGSIEEKIIAYELAIWIVDELHIHNIGVDPQYHRQGYASMMLWLITEIASCENDAIIHLEVRRSNRAAISLYEKFGFESVGIRENYYSKQNEDAILMTRFTSSNLEN